MVLAVLKNRIDIESAADSAIRISFVVAGLIMLVGLLFDSAWVVFFGALAMFLSLFEWFQMRTADTLDDSFMGYDFSQGYTSLERSDRPNHRPAAAKDGLKAGASIAGRQGTASTARRRTGAATARRHPGKSASERHQFADGCRTTATDPGQCSLARPGQASRAVTAASQQTPRAFFRVTSPRMSVPGTSSNS